jgi:hypothetical protein
MDIGVVPVMPPSSSPSTDRERRDGLLETVRRSNEGSHERARLPVKCWERARGRLRTGTASPYPAIYAGPSIVTPSRQSTETAGRQAQAPLILAPKLPSFHPRGGRAVDSSIHGQRNRLTGPPIFGTSAPAPLFCRIGRLFSLCVPWTIRTPDPTNHHAFIATSTSPQVSPPSMPVACWRSSPAAIFRSGPAPRPLAHRPSSRDRALLPLQCSLVPR